MPRNHPEFFAKDDAGSPSAFTVDELKVSLGIIGNRPDERGLELAVDLKTLNHLIHCLPAEVRARLADLGPNAVSRDEERSFYFLSDHLDGHRFRSWLSRWRNRMQHPKRR